MATAPTTDSVPVLVLHNINIVNGGMTFAVLKRAEALAAVCQQVLVFTYGFHRDFAGCVQHWKNSLENSENLHFINLFEGSGLSQREPNSIGPGEHVIKDPKNPGGQRVFTNGVYSRYEKRDASGCLDFVDYFQAPWTRVKKDVYSRSGHPLVTHYMDKATNKISYSTYQDPQGKPIYSVKVNPESGKPTSYFCFLDYAEGRECRSLEEVVGIWLVRELQHLVRVVLFADKREFAGVFAEIPAERRVFCFHSTHLEYPSEDRDSLHPTLNGLKVNLGAFDQIISLTESQSEDLRRTFGLSRCEVVTIPHPQKEIPQAEQQPIDFYNQKVTSVARYHSAKNLKDAIRAFALVLEEFPDASYDIYGYGPEKQALQELIDELQIGESVKLRGFVQNTHAVYRDSCVTILSSQYEGQPLVLGESMAVGVPVVAYDCNYGPRDVIRNNVDGILVRKHDVAGLAEGIKEILRDPSFRRELSTRAREVSTRFSESKYREELVTRVLAGKD